MVVMSPAGDIAMQQRDLIIVSTGLMLLIIVPVIFLTLYFAWRYRRANVAAKYDPEWHHSMRLEVVIWSAPLAIIIALGAITWISTHKLDPFRPLDRIDAQRPIPKGLKPLTIEVVAMDWKWLFFYPDQGIATVNEIATPVDVPIEFKITASSVMNSFYIPAMAGQIYAMPGMQTRLNAIMNKPGVFYGYSTNYSGAGFSHMSFTVHSVDRPGFDQWVATVKQRGTTLNRDTYFKLDKPSEKEPVHYYAAADKDLFDAIVNLCVAPGKMCMRDMMHIDKMGGAGKESAENREKLEYDNRHLEAEERTTSPTFPASDTPAFSRETPSGTDLEKPEPEPGQHDGHQDGSHDMDNMPGMDHDKADPAPKQLIK